MIRKRLAAAVCLALLAGCSSSPISNGVKPPAGPPVAKSITNTGARFDFWHGRVDGVECIVVVNSGATGNFGANGITCNWGPKA